MVSTVTLSSETDRILKTAERLFLSGGFHRVSMDDLAGELGISKKTLYVHFASKEVLVHAVLEHRVRKIDASLRALLAEPAAFDQRLRRLIGFLHGKMSEVSPIFLEDIRRRLPESFRIVEEYRGRAIPGYFGELLADGIRQGHLRGDLDTGLVVRMLVTCIQGIMRPNLLAESHLTPTETIDAILSVFFRGLLTSQGREACADTFSP